MRLLAFEFTNSLDLCGYIMLIQTLFLHGHIAKLKKIIPLPLALNITASQLPLSTLNGFDTHFWLFCQFRSAMNPEKRHSR